MDSLLVLSSEPALGETLASELPDFTVAQALPTEAVVALAAHAPKLVIVDGENTPPEAKAVAHITLSRPVRLRDLLYTIHAQLQSKTAAVECALTPHTRFLPQERLLKAGGAADIALTEKEVELLQSLLENDRRPIARDALLKRVWGYSEDITTHTLETHIYRLRGKLRQAEETLDIVFSEEGGYRLARGRE